MHEQPRQQLAQQLICPHASLLGALRARQAQRYEAAALPAYRQQFVGLLDETARQRIITRLSALAPADTEWKERLAAMPTPASGDLEAFFQARQHAALEELYRVRIHGLPARGQSVTEGPLLWSLAWCHARILLGQPYERHLHLEHALMMKPETHLTRIEWLDLAAQRAYAEVSPRRSDAFNEPWLAHAQSLWRKALVVLDEALKQQETTAPHKEQPVETVTTPLPDFKCPKAFKQAQQQTPKTQPAPPQKSQTPQPSPEVLYGWQLWCSANDCGISWERKQYREAIQMFPASFLPLEYLPFNEVESSTFQRVIDRLDLLLMSPPDSQGDTTAEEQGAAWWGWSMLHLTLLYLEEQHAYQNHEDNILKALHEALQPDITPPAWLLAFSSHLLRFLLLHDEEKYAPPLLLWLYQQPIIDQADASLRLNVLPGLAELLASEVKDEETKAALFAAYMAFVDRLPEAWKDQQAMARQLWQIELERARWLRDTGREVHALTAQSRALSWAELSQDPEATQVHLDLVAQAPAEAKSLLQRAFALVQEHDASTREQVCVQLAATLATQGDTEQAESLLWQALTPPGGRWHSASEALRAVYALEQLDRAFSETQRADLQAHKTTCLQQIRAAHDQEIERLREDATALHKLLKTSPQDRDIADPGAWHQMFFSTWDIVGRAWQSEDLGSYLARQPDQPTSRSSTDWTPEGAIACGCEYTSLPSQETYFWSPCPACQQELIEQEQARHISLAAPILHPWCFHGLKPLLGVILGCTRPALQALLNEEAYIATTTGWDTPYGTGSRELYCGEIVDASQREAIANWSYPPSLETGIAGLKEALLYLSADTAMQRLRAASSNETERVTEQYRWLQAYERDISSQGVWLNDVIVTTLPVIPTSIFGASERQQARLQDCYKALLEENQRLMKTQTEQRWQPMLQEKAKQLFVAFLTTGETQSPRR